MSYYVPPDSGGNARSELTLLHLETGEDVVDRVNDLLRDEYESITVVVESSPESALERIEADTVDCVVSGTELAEMDSLEFLKRVRAIDPDLPFLFYQTDEDEEYITKAVSVGANDVIEPKGRTNQTELLAERIGTLVGKYRTQEQLRKSNRQFGTLISNLPGMVYRCKNEPGWPMVFVSDGCQRLTGYESDALLEGTIAYGDDIIAPEDQDRVWSRIQDAVKNDEPYQLDYQIVTADGDRRWVWERGQGLTSQGGTLELEGFVADITDRKRQHRRIEVLNRVIRHNLRNRMSVILSHASHLEETGDGTAREHAAKIQSTAQEVSELSSAVKEIEQIIGTSIDDCHPISVSRAVEPAVERLRGEHPEATIAVDTEPNLHAMATDQLSLVVRQAVQNAIVHDDNESPSVIVETRTGDSPRTVEVRMLDDGPGIKDMEVDALDDRREITELAHGSGLGLWVMKWFVDAVNGELSIEEREPRGTAITFTLPKADRTE